MERNVLCTEDAIKQLSTELQKILDVDDNTYEIIEQYISMALLYGLSQPKMLKTSTGLAMFNMYGRQLKTFVTMHDAVLYLYKKKKTKAKHAYVASNIYKAIKGTRNNAFGYGWKLLKL